MHTKSTIINCGERRAQFHTIRVHEIHIVVRNICLINSTINLIRAEPHDSTVEAQVRVHIIRYRRHPTDSARDNRV
jgi:hypothetical protein